MILMQVTSYLQYDIMFPSQWRQRFERGVRIPSYFSTDTSSSNCLLYCRKTAVE